MSPTGTATRVLLHPQTRTPTLVPAGAVLVVVDDGLTVVGVGAVQVGGLLTMNRRARLVRTSDGAFALEAVAVGGYASTSEIAPAPPATLPAATAADTRMLGAARVLDIASAFLPTRLANEEFGDCLEDLHARAERGQHAFLLYAKVASTIVWTVLHAIHHGWRQVEQRKGGS